MSRFVSMLFSVLVLACSPSSGPTLRGVGAGEPGAVPVAAPPSAPGRALAAEPSREGWNDAQIAWMPHDEGLARARAEGKSVLLVVHADWCGHCVNYSHVFEDPRIVERARELVMIRVDSDAERAIASRYELDGGYVPRTFFLGSDGSVRREVDARRERFRYFFDESDPRSLLAAMETVLAR